MENLQNNLPIYVRIVTGLKDAILSGEIKEESQMPSTTFISTKFNININTVNKAINALVDEGLIYKKRGIGMFVSKGAQAKLIKERRKTFKDYYVKATLMEAKRLKYSVEELQKIVKEAYQALEGK